ncbi:hypothetical protein B0A50_08674 [Salinomyces thailandicus]|uniref:Uncharacterized protein n=1 Tax=Salinomyces thailandicus TaxID=706561 RepID=A0A4U0TJK9_9PEZI|nr:hypothetical protein B0A50_08674 [Salinomyces thailandica]
MAYEPTMTPYQAQIDLHYNAAGPLGVLGIGSRGQYPWYNQPYDPYYGGGGGGGGGVDIDDYIEDVQRALALGQISMLQYIMQMSQLACLGWGESGLGLGEGWAGWVGSEAWVDWEGA